MPEPNVTINATTAGSEDWPSANANLFGKYQIGKLLGYGAFAKVYYGRDLRSGQNVAVKAVSKQRVMKGGMSEHVKREISIMRRVKHPHIVRLHEVLATKTKIYFVMDFAKGGELFAKVSKARFSEDLSRRYFQQLISAVSHCHSHGVFHRDLKPENLLLDENWDLKVTDFGLSAVSDQIRPDGLLHTLCGTPAYVAPEVLSKKGYDGAKVDIWSCGIILFVLTAGYLPFNDTNLMVMYRKIYRGEFRCPKWTSPELKRFLGRLLDTNPETRITIDEIVVDPWFKKGYKGVTNFSSFDELDLKDGREEEDDDGDEEACINAFDIISFSSGFDLSGLFDCAGVSVDGDQFLSAESPGKIMDRIAEVGEAEGLKVVKREGGGMRLEGRNGNFVAVIGVHRLPEKLVLVEVRRRESGMEPGEEMWRDKLRPQISGLIKRDGQVASDDEA